MTRKIHVVINPGSGQPRPILHTLNQVFRPAGIDWDVQITKAQGDACKSAQEAADAGVDLVAVFGGDGTVMEVARGVKDTQVPMAILPGGTANLMSVELGIPRNLTEAVEIAANPASAVKSVDIGKIGDAYFLLRVGMGVAAQKVELADRELKDRFGIMAYSIAALKAMKDAEKVKYKFTLDGEEYEEMGISCLVDNAGNFGVSGFRASKQVSVFDGLFDVFLIRDKSFQTFISIGKTVATSVASSEAVQHWQANEIEISADPPQHIQVDGEIGWETPVKIKVKPGAVKILTKEDLANNT